MDRLPSCDFFKLLKSLDRGRTGLRIFLGHRLDQWLHALDVFIRLRKALVIAVKQINEHSHREGLL